MVKREFTPKSLYFCHDDGYQDTVLIGHRFKREYQVFHQAILLTTEDTAALKEFLRGVKQLDIRIGLSQEGEGPYFVQFMGFNTDREDSFENDFGYPPIPDLCG